MAEEKDKKEEIKEEVKADTSETKGKEVEQKTSEAEKNSSANREPADAKITEDKSSFASSSTEAMEDKKAMEDKPADAESSGVAKENVEVPKKFKTLVDGIESMSVLDLHELVKLLEKKFGVSAAAVAVAGGGMANGATDETEEKSTFDVELSAVGDQKIAVIKVVKAASGLGLKEAKDLVDSAPVILKKGLKKEDAENLKKEIEEAGGKVELK